MKTHDIIIIGGGAAGYFAAIQAATAKPKTKVLIVEKTNSALTKVKISGGGRCNVTHDCDYPNQLIEHYPRGGKKLKNGFRAFGTAEIRTWFEERGVQLKVEEDGRVFPVTDNSQTIIDCFEREVKKLNIEVRLRTEVKSVEKGESGFSLMLRTGEILNANKVIIAAGGNKRSAAYNWLRDLDIEISNPIPSLFTFNVPNSAYKDLMGLSVPHARVQIPGTKWKQSGALLITHWGFSAPAVIKLSAWAAIDLHLAQYQFPILINWCDKSEEEVREEINALVKEHPKKQIGNIAYSDIPKRLWHRILKHAEINEEQILGELPKKPKNKLIELLVRSPFQVNGKTTFKEEFVTCGGVELSEVDLNTFESKKHVGLYFAGEVLNVDGVTGGFNFQHAWTSGYLAGRHAALD